MLPGNHGDMVATNGFMFTDENGYQIQVLDVNAIPVIDNTNVLTAAQEVTNDGSSPSCNNICQFAESSEISDQDSKTITIYSSNQCLDNQVAIEIVEQSTTNKVETLSKENHTKIMRADGHGVMKVVNVSQLPSSGQEIEDEVSRAYNEFTLALSQNLRALPQEFFKENTLEKRRFWKTARAALFDKTDYNWVNEKKQKIKVSIFEIQSKSMISYSYNLH